jgi:parallel beta-helix repeat protein
LSATAQSSTQILLTWNASTDNVGVAGYRIYRAGVQVGTSTTTSFTDGSLTAATTYSYSVAAYDAAGNVSAQSATISATTLSSSSGHVIEIFPSNANASCNEEFENVANTLQPGDTLILHGGTYTQSCRRYISGIQGTATNPITIEAAAGEIPILTRPDSSQNNIEIDALSNVIIRGLHFQGGDSGVRLMNVNHFTFEDNEVFGTDNNAIRANDANTDSLIIRHNHIHDTGLFTGGTTEGEGMYLGCNNNICRVTNSLVVGNYIHNLRGTSAGGNDGIELKVGSANNVIRDNVIHDTNIGEAFPCITVYGGGTAVNTIEGNVGWNCGEGMYVVSDAIVRNNIIFNSSTGISSYPHQQVAQMKNLTVENNTFYNNSDCFYLRWSGATNMVLSNNAAYCPSGNAPEDPRFAAILCKAACLAGVWTEPHSSTAGLQELRLPIQRTGISGLPPVHRCATQQTLGSYRRSISTELHARVHTTWVPMKPKVWQPIPAGTSSAASSLFPSPDSGLPNLAPGDLYTELTPRPET